MSYIQTPGFARSLLVCAIASLSLAAVADDNNHTVSEQSIADKETVVVTATRMPTRYNQLIADVSVVDQETIQEYGPAAPISQVLANEPGITIKSNGGLGSSTSVSIRGSTNGQSLLLIDGMRIDSSTLGGANWAYVPLQQIGRMEIVRGPSSTMYGADAIGGVVQLFTRKGEGPAKVYADAGYGTYGTSAETVGVEGAQDGLSYSVYAGNTHSLGMPTFQQGSANYNPNDASYTNSSGSTRLAYTVQPGQEVGASVVYGEGRNAYTNSATQMRYATQIFSVASVYTQNKILDSWTSLVRGGYSNDNNNNYLTPTGAFYSKFQTQQYQGQWQNDIKLPVGKAMLAYEFLKQDVTSSTAYTVTSRNINSFIAGWNGDYGNNLFNGSIRNDNNSQFGNATTGSVGYGYFLTPTLRATASWGTAFQAPTFNQLYYPGYGNPNLSPTRSQNTEAGFRYDDGTHRAGVVYYNNNIKNLIVSNPTNNYLPENIGQSVIQGVTTTYGGKVYGLDINGSVDYQNPINKQTNQILTYHPQAFGSLTVQKKMDWWNLGAQYQASASQQTSDPAVGPGSSSNRTLGGYGLINMFGSIDIYKDVSVFARANNIFDRQYTTAYNSSSGYYRNPGANFFVGLRFQQK